MNGDNKQDKRGPAGGPPKLPFNNRIALISLLVLVVITNVVIMLLEQAGLENYQRVLEKKVFLK